MTIQIGMLPAVLAVAGFVLAAVGLFLAFGLCNAASWEIPAEED